ncbi:MAG: hypothetical protein JWP97_1494 [Labilithrix sp.]|nr:hypothetical protein [Labilithrix sp.]
MQRSPSVSLVALLVAALAAVAGCSGASEEDDAEASGEALTSLGAGEYRAYAAVAAEAGAAPAGGQVTVLGLRGVALDGSTHGTTFHHAFDDTLVVLGADGASSFRFAASTHPFEKKGVSGVPDVDGDRVADVGMIRPGIYDVAGRERLIAGQPSFVVTREGSGRLPGWRDVDHDGVLAARELAASEQRGDVLTDVLFHQGEGGAPAAVGCQVLPAADIRAFVRAIGGAKARFRYVLVDASGLAPDALPHGK